MPTKKATPKKAPVKKNPSKTAAKAVKKTVKKASKKVVAKSKTGKAGKPLVYANDKKSFWIKDGQILNSLVALRDALDEMEKEVFAYHVAKDRNDFAAWVDDVLCDAECAAALAKAKTAKSAKTVVIRHLKHYTV